MMIPEILYIAETSRKTLTAIAQINFIVRKDDPNMCLERWLAK